jgi:hypothetical protein
MQSAKEKKNKNKNTPYSCLWHTSQELFPRSMINLTFEKSIIN